MEVGILQRDPSRLDPERQRCKSIWVRLALVVLVVSFAFAVAAFSQFFAEAEVAGERHLFDLSGVEAYDAEDGSFHARRTFLSLYKSVDARTDIPEEDKGVFQGQVSVVMLASTATMAFTIVALTGQGVYAFGLLVVHPLDYDPRRWYKWVTGAGGGAIIFGILALVVYVEFAVETISDPKFQVVYRSGPASIATGYYYFIVSFVCMVLSFVAYAYATKYWLPDEHEAVQPLGTRVNDRMEMDNIAVGDQHNDE